MFFPSLSKLVETRRKALSRFYSKIFVFRRAEKSARKLSPMDFDEKKLSFSGSPIGAFVYANLIEIFIRQVFLSNCKERKKNNFCLSILGVTMKKFSTEKISTNYAENLCCGPILIWFLVLLKHRFKRATRSIFIGFVCQSSSFLSKIIFISYRGSCSIREIELNSTSSIISKI